MSWLTFELRLIVRSSRRFRVTDTGLTLGPLTVSVAVSLTAEFLQMFVPGRVVSFADVTAQTLG